MTAPDDPAGGRAQPTAADVHGLLAVVRRLWPEPVAVRLLRQGRQPVASTAAAPERDWLVLPTASRPRLLLPAWSAPAAKALLRDDHGQRNPQIVRALALLHRQGMLARLPLARIRVGVADGADTVETELAKVFGAARDLVVRLGRRRWNRSIVLRPLDSDGRTLAFVKAAAGTGAIAAQRRERENLRRIAGLAPRLVEWPDVLHHGSWREQELLALSPLLGDGSARPARAPSEAMRSLALAAEDGSRTLADADLSRRLWAGAHGLRDSAQRGQLMTGIEATLARLGQVKVPIGCWHGDWVPWNMTVRGGRVLLWDWEHFDEGVPLGFDGIHYRAQQLRMSKGTDRRVEDRWVREASEWLLNTFQLSASQIRAVILAYLLEINLRYLRDRENDPLGTTPRAGWGLPLIGRLTSELD